MRKAVAILLWFVVTGGTIWAQQYLITTVAGGGGLPLGPVPATSVALGTTSAVAADANGDVYFIASNCVFKVDVSGVLTRVAGGSTVPGYAGDGGPAASAKLDNPSGLAVDAAGNLYIADYFNNVIREVAAATGIITTVAGNGTSGHSGDGGPAVNAQLERPIGVAIDAAGNLYIAEDSFVREVAALTGIITTVAGSGRIGYPIYSGDGGPATSAQLYPSGVAVDAAGNLYIASSDAIREVAATTGIITTVAGGGTAVPGDGGPATNALLIAGSVAVDAAGNLYIADFMYNVIRKVTAATGIITTVAGNGSLSYAGDGGPASSAGLNQPQGIAVDAAGNLYIGDSGNNAIRKVTAATGIITTIAGNGPRPFGGPGLNTGDSGDGGPATSAQLSPGSVAVDVSGNLYVADGHNSVIREVVAATGIITKAAGTGTPGYSGDGGPATGAQLDNPGGVAVDAAGNLYISDVWNNVIRKVTAATGLITTVTWTILQLDNPRALAVDGSGNIYVVDGIGIRKVPAAPGLVTRVAGIPGSAGIALDGAGNLYVADTYGSVIRKVAVATGIITTVAGNGTFGYSGDGGPATSAALNEPESVAVDGSGNLYIGDTYNNVIRKVAASSGIITTIAGNGTAGYSGDGGPALSAWLSQPQSLAVDAGGNVYVADAANNVIRMLVPAAIRALLRITSTHSADFARGQTSASYVVVVSNAAGAGPTSSTVTVTETVPVGLAAVSISGVGWDCSGVTCTRNDVLSPGASYPPITVTVNVAADAPSLVMNQAAISGGGSTAASATDLTTISTVPPATVLLASPANRAASVVLTPTLAWETSAEAVSYDVYFGTLSTPPLVATNTTGTSYAPGTMSQNTTYYWQIVARNGIGSTASAIWSFTTGGPAIGLQFVPVTPCRVADTRTAVGPFGGPTMVAHETRSFAIPQSACGIPATAKAYSINTTVVPQLWLGYLTLWPTGEAQPFVSTLNSWTGQVVANAAIVPAGSGGAVSVYVTGDTDVILDINGYFDTPGGANSSSFYAAPPCRVADTRNPTGEFGGPSMFAGQTRDFPIPLSACQIPAGSSAYSLNVTAVPGTDYLAYLTTWPTGRTQPYVSTLNSWYGRPVANAAIVPAGSNGSVSVFATDPTDVVLDIDGYFGQPGAPRALSFYPVAPCRVADTRNPDGPFGGPEMAAQSTRSFAIPASACNIPSTAEAYSVNVTVVPGYHLSYLTAWPTGSPQPFVSTLNSWDWAPVANAAIIPAGTNGAVSIYVTDYTHVILDINGYFAP